MSAIFKPMANGILFMQPPGNECQLMLNPCQLLYCTCNTLAVHVYALSPSVYVDAMISMVYRDKDTSLQQKSFIEHARCLKIVIQIFSKSFFIFCFK